MIAPAKVADELGIILRNLKCDVEIDHSVSYYRINQERFCGVFSFIARARRALAKAGIHVPDEWGTP